MATARITGPSGMEDVEDVEGVTLNGQFEDMTDLQRDVDGQINSIFMEFGNDERDTTFKIVVKRVIEGRGELEHCFSALPSELPIIPKIEEQYGPGQYEIWVYKDGKIFKRPKLNIAKPLRPSNTRNQTTELAGILAAMQEMQARQFEQLQAVIARQQPSAPAFNPMETMQQMAAMMASFQQLMPRPSNPMEMLKPIMELVGDLQDGNREKGLYDVISNVADKVLPVIGSMAARQGAARPPMPAAPGAPVTQPVSAPQTAAISQQPQENDDMKNFKNQLGILVSMAKADADPSLYAELILDQIPEGQVKQLIEAPNLRETLIQFNPDVEGVWPWFSELTTEIRKLLTEDESGGDTTGETLNGTDTHAVTRPGQGDTGGNS